MRLGLLVVFPRVARRVLLVVCALELWAVIAVGPAVGQRLKLSASLSDLEARARTDSNDAAAHYNVALAYWNAKRWDDAGRSLRLAVTIDPRFAQAYLALSRLPYARRGALWDEVERARVPKELTDTVEESDRFYRRAYLIDPLVDMKIEGAVAPPRSVYWDLFDPEGYDLFYRGFDDLREGKYPDALDRLDRLLGLFRRDRHDEGLPAGLLWYRAVASAHVEKYDQAQRDLDELLARAEHQERSDSLIRVPLRTNEFRYVLAYVEQRGNNPNRAIFLYRQAIENDVGLYMAHVRLAEIYEGAQRWDQAVEHRQNAVNANPDDPSLLLDLGRTLASAGRLAEALDPLQQAADANPRDSRVYFYLGLVLEQAGKKAEARAALTRFTSLAPSRYDRQITIARQHLAGLQ